MKNKIIFVNANTLGRGDEALGEAILENFFTLLKQQENKPRAIFLMNSGVLLATKQSLISVHLKEIADAGVEVLLCTTCLNHYELANELVVGTKSTMAHFIALASEYEVITL